MHIWMLHYYWSLLHRKHNTVVNENNIVVCFIYFNNTIFLYGNHNTSTWIFVCSVIPIISDIKSIIYIINDYTNYLSLPYLWVDLDNDIKCM